MAGRLFSFTIRPGRLSLPSVAYEFTSIPGRVQFPFDFSLVAVTRIRASVSTPPKLTFRGIHSREQTQPLHTPRSTPSCISIQDPSRRVEVLRGTHYSTYPPKRKKMCLSGSVLLSWVGRVRPEMLCLHTRLPLFPKASRGLLYDDGRPPVGGLLHKAPAEEKLYPSE